MRRRTPARSSRVRIRSSVHHLIAAPAGNASGYSRCPMRQAIPSDHSIAPLSAAVVAEGRFVFVSGQVPFKDGEFVDGTIEEQTALTLENVRAVLAEAG